MSKNLFLKLLKFLGVQSSTLRYSAEDALKEHGTD